MRHTITLSDADEAALALKLERHNANVVDRGELPATAADYLGTVVSEVLGPERAEHERERRERLATKLDELSPQRRAAILAELGEG